MIYPNNITIGADPELFIINEKTGKVVSAVGMIPGKKGDPYVSEDMPEGFGLETDNILGEFNIPPCTNVDSFINNIEYMKNYINDYVKKINPDYGILCTASMLVDEDQLQSKQAKEFGCSVDYNAYTENANPKPKGTSTNLRSAGFHIHIGYDNPNVETSLWLIKRLDFFLGIPSVAIDPDTKRRSLYGKAGAFRLTPYGLEYRVLSSAMMKTPEILNLVWDKIMKALDYEYDITLPSDEVERIINESDVNAAKRFCK